MCPGVKPLAAELLSGVEENCRGREILPPRSINVVTEAAAPLMEAEHPPSQGYEFLTSPFPSCPTDPPQINEDLLERINYANVQTLNDR